MTIFQDRGIDVDFEPDLGKDKKALAERIGDYDGLAIRSTTKITSNILKEANKLKVIGRAGIGVDNIDKIEASKKGIIIMNTPFGNMITADTALENSARIESPAVLNILPPCSEKRSSRIFLQALKL